MNSSTATGKTFWGIFSLFVLLLAVGVAWSQNDKDKNENKEKKPAPTHSNAPASRPATTRPQENGNRGGETNTRENENRGTTGEAGRGTANTGAANGREGANTNAGRENGRAATNGGAGNRGEPTGRINNGPGNTGARGTNAAGARPVGGAGAGRTVNARGGLTARVNSSGRVVTVHAPGGMTIHNGPNGARTVVTVRSDHTRIVSTGRGAGFVDHPYVRNGRPFLTRTEVVGGRSFAHVYWGAPYRGVVYYHFVPGFRYSVGFWGWMGRPWGAPIRFTWGWGPWFGFYGYYFHPYPTYVDASFWLTDYLISQDLQAAYAAQAAAGAPPPPPQAAGTPLSPELKQEIDDEVKAQMASEQNNQAPPAGAPTADQAPDALSPSFRTFIVSTAMNEQLANGSDCSLAPGDVLTRISDTPDGNGDVNVLVSNSQASDCASGSQLAMSVQDLQDMHNAFAQQVDSGVNQMGQSEGQNGLPAGPPPMPVAVPDGTAQPDPQASAELEQQNTAAQQADEAAQSAAQ